MGNKKGSNTKPKDAKKPEAPPSPPKREYTDDEKRAMYYAKISKVMAGVSPLAKNGRNKNQGYDYVLESDITEMVRKLIVDAGLAITWQCGETETKERETRNGKTYMVSAGITICMVDTETGRHQEFTVIGEASDTGDKAIWKAYTGAFKYWMMKTFLIAGSDDPEQDTDADQDAGQPTGQPQGNQSAKNEPAEKSDKSAEVLEDRLFQESMKSLVESKDMASLKDLWRTIRPLVVKGEKQKIFTKARRDALSGLMLKREAELKKEGGK